MGKLDGKVALVTGGNSGMGLATAQLFAAEGAKVIITGRRKQETDEAAQSSGPNVEGFVGDIASLADLDRLHDYIATNYGKVDIIFANAGIGDFVPFGQVTEEQFDRVFDVNVKGTFFTVQKLLSLVPDGGSVILNGSSPAIRALRRSPSTQPPKPRSAPSPAPGRRTSKRARSASMCLRLDRSIRLFFAKGD